MTTCGDFFGLVARDAGVLAVGQTLQAQQVNDMQARANMMISQWKRRRWLVPHLVDVFIRCDGSQSYTIGRGCQIETYRPDQIDAAYARQVIQSVPNQVDYPLRIIRSHEEYSEITLKNMEAGPSWAVFYDSNYPEGRLYPYPLMNDQYELGALTDEILLPPEYNFALYANLMQLTRSAFRLPPDQFIDKQAKSSLETIRSANFQVGTMNMPAAVAGYGGYNIWSDSWGPGR
jgi:hypothetical protein